MSTIAPPRMRDGLHYDLDERTYHAGRVMTALTYLDPDTWPTRDELREQVAGLRAGDTVAHDAADLLRIHGPVTIANPAGGTP